MDDREVRDPDAVVFISDVAVPLKIDCTPPTLSASAAPTTLGPPNGKLVTVTVFGAAADGSSGTDPASTSFSVWDDYGCIQPGGQVTLTPQTNGSYTYAFAIQLEARREGRDRAGRDYRIKVSAADKAGNTSLATAKVEVVHDRR